MASLIELTQRLDGLRTARKRLKAEYEEGDKRLESEIKDTMVQIAASHGGIDLEQVALAETAFYFRGDPSKYSEGHSAVQDASTAIACDTNPLAVEYIGLKNYEHWHGQREDHRYGYGPKHGTTVLAIGRRAPKESVTDAQREAALYFLNNWKAIITARETAAKHAARSAM